MSRSVSRFGAATPAAEYGALAGVTLRAVCSLSAVPGDCSRTARARLARECRAPSRARPSPELAAAAAEAAAAPNVARDRRWSRGGRADRPGAASTSCTWPTISNRHFGRRSRLPDGARSVSALRRFERRCCCRRSESWMASQRDVAARPELAPQARLRYVPNVVDVSSIRSAPTRVTAPRALFVGDFSYPPNVHATRGSWSSEVMPRVWERLPAARAAGCRTRSRCSRRHRSARASRSDSSPHIDDAYARAACVGRSAAGGRRLAAEVRRGSGTRPPGRGHRARRRPGWRSKTGVHYRRADDPAAVRRCARSTCFAIGAADIAQRGRRTGRSALLGGGARRLCCGPDERRCSVKIVSVMTTTPAAEPSSPRSRCSMRCASVGTRPSC